MKRKNPAKMPAEERKLATVLLADLVGSTELAGDEDCALAAELRGDEDEARRLEAKAETIGMQGWRFWLDPPRIRLALARADLDALPALLDGAEPDAIEPPAAILDALVALGERERIDEEAPKWLRPGTYAEPFALRALGLVHEDEALVEQAARAFDALGLPWHARRTRERRIIGPS